jgi:hypothetical protein
MCGTPISEALCIDFFEGEFRASCPASPVCSYTEGIVTYNVYGDDTDESYCED